ncbi:MAG: cupin domain-containing protein [Chloroflexi bacterium]|nr:cupin domain-containing protein [Chloroflexota bacterium]
MVMEREMMREAEEEPREYESQQTNTYVPRDAQRTHVASLPRVIHAKDIKGFIPGAKGAAKDKKGQQSKGGKAIYLSWQHHNWKEMRHPIYTMRWFGTAGTPGAGFKPGASGCHRHWMEAIFYRPGGKYVEEQDGVLHECEGEGVVCIPTYCIHGHYFVEPPTKRGVTILSRIFEPLGIADMEVFDVDEDYVRRGSPLGDFHIWEDTQEMMYARRNVKWAEGEPKTIYDRFVKMTADEYRWRLQTDRWIAADSKPWEQTRQGKIKYLIHPWDNSVIRTIDCYLQEIPPGGFSGKHRHVYEEVFLVTDGRGYTIQNGVRYDWQEDDIVCIPIGVTHQHFNTDPHNKAKIFAAYPRAYMWVGHGGVEHLENASDWQPSQG